MRRYMHPVFIVALFTVAEIWKQIMYLLIDGQIKKMWVCVCVCIFGTTWMDLEGIMPSELSLTEKDKYYMVIFICANYNNRTNEQTKQNRN